MRDEPKERLRRSLSRHHEHLFFHCNVTKSFWQLLFSWISEEKVILPSLTLENVFFGVFHVVEDFHVVNHIILLAKCYIYNCKLNGHTSLTKSLHSQG